MVTRAIGSGESVAEPSRRVGFYRSGGPWTRRYAQTVAGGKRSIASSRACVFISSSSAHPSELGLAFSRLAFGRKSLVWRILPNRLWLWP